MPRTAPSVVLLLALIAASPVVAAVDQPEPAEPADVQVALVRVLPPKMKVLAKCNADFCVFKYVDSQ